MRICLLINKHLKLNNRLLNSPVSFILELFRPFQISLLPINEGNTPQQTSQSWRTPRQQIPLNRKLLLMHPYRPVQIAQPKANIANTREQMSHPCLISCLALSPYLQRLLEHLQRPRKLTPLRTNIPDLHKNRYQLK